MMLRLVLVLIGLVRSERPVSGLGYEVRPHRADAPSSLLETHLKKFRRRGSGHKTKWGFNLFPQKEKVRPLPELEGKLATKEEFQKMYSYNWQQKWQRAATLEARKLSLDGKKKYTRKQWEDRYGESKDANKKWELADWVSPVDISQEVKIEYPAERSLVDPSPTTTPAGKAEYRDAAAKNPEERRPLPPPEKSLMKTEQEFLAKFGARLGEKKWQEAEHLEERRFGADGGKYTAGQWADAFGNSSEAWQAARHADAAKMIELDLGFHEEANEDAVRQADARARKLDQETAEAKQAAKEAKSLRVIEEEAKRKAKEAKEAQAELEAARKKHEVVHSGHSGPQEEDGEDEELDENAELGADEISEMDIPIAGSNTWPHCPSRNAHRCGDKKHCCCNVGSKLHTAEKTCKKSGKGDKDPDVVRRQIPGSRVRAEFGVCSEARGHHTCGSGCCCSGLLEFNVDSQTCETPPSAQANTWVSKPLPDAAPPKEEPIPGSQTWKQVGATCESKEAYSCGKERSHCCCRFGCEFIEIWDKCGHCKDNVPMVVQNLIPASQLWELRVKKGVCNAKRSHPCGPGCCCNAGWTWNKEQRRCQDLDEGNEEPDTSPPPEEPSPEPEPKGSACAAGMGLASAVLLFQALL
ncbi:unnamed protein product [Effrenium voratum]|uniref:Uncharacterized protein n=1 Tax=Effrenium voratum TaxID=2562239 RepID=A0AA36J8X3_9DINO|nr:unnamed protein product [Effrenium voratum]